MDHNNKTLCEKIAEGFVISFLIALLVVPCDLFQPTMWASQIAYPSKEYILDYRISDSDTDQSGDIEDVIGQNMEANPSQSENLSSSETELDKEVQTAEPNSSKDTQRLDKNRKTGYTSSKSSLKSANNANPNNPTNANLPELSPEQPRENSKDTEGYIISQEPVKKLPEEFPVNADQVKPNSAIQESEIFFSGDSLKVVPIDTIPVMQSYEAKFAIDSLKAVTGDSIRQAFIADSLDKADPLRRFNVWVPRELDFNPDPKRAVWLSALFPGLGQIYNRRYWKLPIVVGAYMGLAYATNWNNTMLGDYTRAYRDIMDTDPSTNSYMDFFPPTVDESSLDKTWLKNILYSRKNYFRRYRDLCIILMVGVYLLAMVDAYVDASLAHFDISQDLSLDWSPAVFHDGYAKWPSVGVSWAFNF